MIHNFKLSCSRHKPACQDLAKKGFIQVPQIQISPDGSDFKGLQEDLIISITILLLLNYGNINNSSATSASASSFMNITFQAFV